MTEKNKATLLQSAVDAARRIIKPMTKEEEYRNADVPIPKAHKNFDEWLVTGLTDNVDDLKSRVQLAALTIKNIKRVFVRARQRNRQTNFRITVTKS